jgi:hypothetical protein
LNQNRALIFRFDAFSKREPAPTSLENAIERPQPACWPLSNTPAFVRNQDRAVLAREEPDDATVLNAVLFMVVWSS